MPAKFPCRRVAGVVEQDRDGVLGFGGWRRDGELQLARCEVDRSGRIADESLRSILHRAVEALRGSLAGGAIRPTTTAPCAAAGIGAAGTGIGGHSARREDDHGRTVSARCLPRIKAGKYWTG